MLIWMWQIHPGAEGPVCGAEAWQQGILGSHSRGRKAAEFDNRPGSLEGRWEVKCYGKRGTEGTRP